MKGALAANKKLVPGFHLAPSFAKKQLPSLYEKACEGVNVEAFEGLANDWGGSLSTLREACQLITR